MAITAIIGRGLGNAALALVVSWWPWYTRLVWGVTRSLKERHFVEAARAIGVRDSRIILCHILPNTISPILVQATVDLEAVILAMGGLASLGLGTQPPAPDRGLMVSEGRSLILDQWRVATFPGAAIFAVVLAFNPLADTFRDVFDPRQYLRARPCSRSTTSTWPSGPPEAGLRPSTGLTWRSAAVKSSASRARQAAARQ